MPELWLPGVEGPHDAFLDRLQRQIAAVAPKPFVEIELQDGSRFAVESIEAEPGFGFVALRPHPTGEPPDLVIVPLASIKRIEVSRAEEERAKLGFSSA
jgi:hypothetical protein